MLRIALILLSVALAAALFGFGGVVGASAGMAQLLFFVLIVLFAVSLIAHLARGTGRTV